jgi:4-hydroxybenzoate polyprenyltransferase
VKLRNTNLQIDSLRKPKYLASASLKWLSSIVTLSRLFNSLAIGLLFIGSERLFAPKALAFNDYLKGITWTMIASIAYIYNDFVDREIDRINKPKRPIPSGNLSVLHVERFLLVFCVITVLSILAAWAGDSAWPLCALACSFFYSRWLRRMSSGFSNLMCSALIAIVPISAHHHIGSPQLWLFAIGLGCLMFAREAQKDVLDLQGDRICRPLPLLLSPFRLATECVYPILLLSTAFCIYSGLPQSNLSIATLFLRGAIWVALVIAALVFVVNRQQYAFQVMILKVASYLIVGVILVEARQ